MSKRFIVVEITPEGEPIRKIGEKYFVVNVSEPIAKAVWNLIREYEKALGTYQGSDVFESYVKEMSLNGLSD